MAATAPDRPRPPWGHRHLVVVGRRVPTYVVLLYVGCVLGTWAGTVAADAAGVDPTRFALAVVVLIVPALVGARLWYVLGHLATYRAEPHRLWRRDEGGSALDGGLVLALVVAVPVLPALDLPYWSFWDAATVTMAVGLVATRLGCAVNGCCTGRPTDGPLGLWMPDLQGRWARRFPTPLLEAGWVLVVLVGVAAVGSDLPFPGARATAVVALYAAGRAVIGATRATDRRTRRAGTAVALGLGAAATVAALLLA
jgi:phosphatidylglycerol:prolipoprotein diacylglycerol transferase